MCLSVLVYSSFIQYNRLIDCCAAAYVKFIVLMIGGARSRPRAHAVHGIQHSTIRGENSVIDISNPDPDPNPQL